MSALDTGTPKIQDSPLFYDDIETGLTTWLRDIIDANARANGITPESATLA
ncbi:hypothetical protein [Nocardia australiensis]|uniref:hypothetical protein n=1 Tax=Nocardia australiensis TaxID=2887191 RepID=UPI001D14CD22|nr:hypothetical protein [Nocardia australiensis]